MRIEHPHAVGQAEAVRRLEGALGQVLSRPLPAGIELQDAQRSWNGGRMAFSFKAKKGFFSTTIGGIVEVTDTAVVIDAPLPAMVSSFFGEDRIRDRIAQELGRLLA
jgi:hypothetical protein